MDTDEFQKRIDTYQKMVREYVDTRRDMEGAIASFHQETRDGLADDVIELVRTGAQYGVTNAQIKDIFGERLDGHYALFSDLPYLLAKEGHLVGTKERRPNKAGKDQQQRVWYLPEYEPNEGGE